MSHLDDEKRVEVMFEIDSLSYLVDLEKKRKERTVVGSNWSLEDERKYRSIFQNLAPEYGGSFICPEESFTEKLPRRFNNQPSKTIRSLDEVKQKPLSTAVAGLFYYNPF